MSQPIKITSFYHFRKQSPAQVEELKTQLENFATENDLKGLFIVGSEGCNSTYCGPEACVEALKKELFNWLETDDLFFKDSWHNTHPFNEFKVKVRDEIVTLDRPGMIPTGEHHHLEPKDWHEALQDENTVIIDTRNDYEYEVGHFKGAINPDIKEFTQFSDYLKKSEIKKEQKVLIYCTGGIRCEKAILEMEDQGFKNVYQLNGGIINYLKEFPEGEWEGECFVFDYRVALDNHLQPSQLYRLCPHCGDPGKVKIECKHCHTEEVVCQKCIDQDENLETCSKNCAHHHRLGHRFKKVHPESRNKRHHQ